MTRFKNKYRIESSRMKEWDYSSPWWYYVTINLNCDYIFGVIEKAQMKLNCFGVICNDCWTEIPSHYPETELDNYVIMPDHLHGIVIINENIKPKINLKKHSLGDILGKFKAAVSREIRKSGITNFKWQERFHDRIIRNEKELFIIRNYIEQNPLRWDIDKNSNSNLPDLL